SPRSLSGFSATNVVSSSALTFRRAREGRMGHGATKERGAGPWTLSHRKAVASCCGRRGRRERSSVLSDERGRGGSDSRREAGEKTVQEALDAYEQYLLVDKGNKPGSVEDTMYRIGTFFSDKEMALGDLSTTKCEGYYQELRTRPTRTKKPFSVDSQRNILAE